MSGLWNITHQGYRRQPGMSAVTQNFAKALTNSDFCTSFAWKSELDVFSCSTAAYFS